MVNDPRLNVSPTGLKPVEPGIFGINRSEYPASPASPDQSVPIRQNDLDQIGITPERVDHATEPSSEQPPTLKVVTAPTQSVVNPETVAVSKISALDDPDNYQPATLETLLGSENSLAA
ncbi:MAG: hypothetical protein CEO22_221 [Candidatus Berkelbacteria bacterium Gr01-1014_85]|uniref:Uncharacterized protein n=1 Tax=Candidatus Berkelbacteria bacterium Gr01-1014_85 TaxID=2017150 RepID=A0A554JCU5_9BACT|nr:MAG: hypothetical protein CEO22_221 [Candidatus Berkelbacteria bacterium Gr01-1014_85]